MPTPSFIAVAGPSGGGKTAWISQRFQDQTRPQFYLYPGLGNISVDLARIGYRFPQVQVIQEDQIQQALSLLPDDAIVYLEMGFHVDLQSPFLSSLSCHRVAVVPSSLQTSGWHDWADEVVPGNTIDSPDADKVTELWRSPLTRQVFDPPSLDDVLIELTGGAYGRVHRVKGIFELPDGRAFYVDFVDGLPGIEYAELNLPRWLDGRPERFSGIEVVGKDLEEELIAQALLDSCLPDEAIAQYQAQYKAYSDFDGEADSATDSKTEPETLGEVSSDTSSEREKELFA